MPWRRSSAVPPGNAPKVRILGKVGERVGDRIARAETLLGIGLKADGGVGRGRIRPGAERQPTVKRCEGVCYSLRRAAMGSTRVARRAGM